MLDATNSQSGANSPVPEPLPIRRLKESLINRIAAGEIIHRPASALKELIENSLDAGSTSIRVTVKDGGLKLLQIQDNGCGIRHSDLPILAQRFTTSKLTTFSDLSRIATYGFRGEALASMSHVSHLSVITKTKADNCAWKACYSGGELTPAKPGQTVEPKPCAGNDGTMITIEDLFYNFPIRLSALRSSSEEYSRILDVLTRYAVHNAKVAFVCKKAGSPTPDLSTPSSSDTAQAIRLLYGQSIAKELLHSAISSKDKKKDVDQLEGDEENSEITTEEDSESWSAEAHFTSVNYHAKKMVFLLFINHRLVESPRIKRALEAVYNGILPKGAFPFVYLSLQIDPRSVDVNVHPTKREVHFLNEEAIMDRVSDTLQETLAKQNHSRVFQYQTLLTSGTSEDNNLNSKKRKGKERELLEDDIEAPPISYPMSGAQKKLYSQHKVRTSQQDRTLDSMFPVANPSRIGDSNTQSKSGDAASTTPKSRDVKESECYLTSVKNLRQAVINGKHRHLTEILEKHTFVGIVDLNLSLSLIQHSTKLYLVNHGALAEELFYQLALRQFGDFSRIKLDPPPPLRELIQLAVGAEETTRHTHLTKAEIVDSITGILTTRREMLEEYFSLNISATGLVESLPLMLPNYVPTLDKLPNFLMRLGPQVDWTSEEECFDSFARELAYFYIPGPLPSLPGPTVISDEEKAAEKAERWQIEHVLFPSMRRYMDAPKSLLDRDVIQVASLPELYRVFERC